MQNRYRRLLLATIVSLSGVAGVAEHALAVTFTEFPVPTVDGGPWSITTGPDGALWFTESFANKIGRITTAGVITEFKIPSANSQLLGGITQGPDGALWFGEEFAGKIGRITTDGVITEFPVPAPSGITTGPDGALWFTELGDKIGRITTAGVITEFKIPTTLSFPQAITTGPDDALWFTENAANKLGRITTAGVITEFPMPTPGFRDLRSITAGPDGALWFTETNAAIGRITTAGVITEFPIPTKGSVIQYITTGPDGALWFTDTFANKIGRITTAGAITEFPLPKAGSGPTGITTGPDGALWFTEQTPNADQIGRLSLPALQVSPSANIAASGPQGGPFSPVSFAYQLSSATDSLNFAISGIPTWLNANFTSGVASTTPVTVTFSLMNLGSFVPGTYTATITFTNTSTGIGNTTRTAALTVVPPSVSSQITNLIALIGSFNLPNGIVNSLDAKLEAALATFNAMKTNSIGTACNQLGAFFNEVAAQSGNKVTDTQANQLISAGNQIKVALGCL
jgi:virginiamycin B lyase